MTRKWVNESALFGQCRVNDIKINDNTGAATKTLLLNTRDVNGMELFQFQPGRIMATAPSTIVLKRTKRRKKTSW
jgi:hypothetical protein